VDKKDAKLLLLLYTLPYVADVSTPKEKKSQGTRIFGPRQKSGRPEDAYPEKAKRTGKTFGLICFARKLNAF